MKRNTVNISSRILLLAYLVMLALPLFHYHPIYLGYNSRLSATQDTPSYHDPFQSAHSECSISQLAITSYINDIAITLSKDLSSCQLDYNPTYESSKSLLVIFDPNGLRAPPAHS